MAINFQNYKFTNQIDTSPLAENTKRTSEGISNLARLGKQIFTSVRDNSNKNKFLELVRTSDGELIEKKEEKKKLEDRIAELTTLLDSKEAELATLKGSIDVSTEIEDKEEVNA